jgi:NAD(P)-dependent dehydrogenase (short-subunit alcohol dehydrogenase family)
MYKSAGKVALVTGAAKKHGIGCAIAVRLAKEGADIAVLDKALVLPGDTESIEGWEGLKSVVSEIQALGCRAVAVTCDITDSSQVDRAVQDIVKKFGQIDILVNNAGIQIICKFLDLKDEIWGAHLMVNLTGTFFVSRAVAKEMVRRGAGGRIINIASQLGKSGSGDGRAAYCASKFGVIGLTQCLALELSPHHILVNSVCPGLTDTDLSADFYRSQAQREGISEKEVRRRTTEQFISHVPLGRLGTVEDVANIVAFLSSEEANFITGQSINVNGGMIVAH